MFNLLNAKRERNYHVVKAAMEIENIDTEERAKEAIKLTFANGKQGTIVAVLVFAILLLLFPQARSMVLALGAVILAWIWGSVLNGRKQILRYNQQRACRAVFDP